MDIRDLKEEILNTTVDTIRSYSKLFKEIAQQAIIFTVGNEEKISEYDKILAVKKLV